MGVKDQETCENKICYLKNIKSIYKVIKKGENLGTIDSLKLGFIKISIN